MACTGRTISPAALTVVLLLHGGCAAGPRTRLELRGNPEGPARYTFEQTRWRPHPHGVEVVGYGLLPYRITNTIYQDSGYPAQGKVVFRLHGVPQPGGGYVLTLLGPAAALGPGDDEVLTAVADPEAVTVEEVGDRRHITLRDVPTRSRNKPDMDFTLSGTIVAAPATEWDFESQLRKFERERGFRGSAALFRAF